jgi:4-hydroxybenzoate polyprenyltransferase
VRLPHTLFALPFAVVGAVFASYRYPVSLAQIFWIVVAFTAARFAAMAFNRVIDRGYDAANPRTRGREIPAGRISVPAAGVAVAAASAAFIFAAAMLNPLCLALSPLALAWLLGYSYAKRYTSWTHLALGIADGIAPAGAYLAISGEWTATPTLILLLLGVGFWVAGFDVLYALQDVEFDRRMGLHSIPARWGERAGLWAARGYQALAAAAFVAAAWIYPEVGGLTFVGIGVTAALLLYEHSLVRVGDLSRLNTAFFTVNAAISAVFAAFVLADRWW